MDPKDGKSGNDPATVREQVQEPLPQRGKAHTLPFRRGATGLPAAAPTPQRPQPPVEESPASDGPSTAVFDARGAAAVAAAQGASAPGWLRPGAADPMRDAPRFAPAPRGPSVPPPQPAASVFAGPSGGASAPGAGGHAATLAAATVYSMAESAVARPPPLPAPPAPIAMPAPSPARPSAPYATYAPSPAPMEPQRPTHASVFGGAQAASNAAIIASGGPPPRQDASLSPSAGAVASAEPIDLVWFDVQQKKRVRIWWKELIADLEFEGFDSKHEVPTDDDDADKLRHEVFGVLTREPAIDAGGLTLALREAIDDTGRFTAPLAVVDVEMRMLHGDVARLEVMCAVLAPLAQSDKRLKDLLDAASEAVGSQRGGGLTASRLTRELRDHHQQTYGKSATASQLDVEVERGLDGSRQYDERTVLGAKFLRATIGAGADAAPAYVPERARDFLPLLGAFRARLLAEVHPRQDRTESHPVALRVIAIARLLGSDGMRP